MSLTASHRRSDLYLAKLDGCDPDLSPPRIVCPTIITLECSGQEGAVVEYSLQSPRDCDPDVEESFTPQPGEMLELGGHTATYRATDGLGHEASCEIAVEVVDTTASVLTCPEDMTVDCAEPGGEVVVHFTVTAADICDPNPVVVSDPPSGSVFGPGRHRVSCTATDASGNSTSCSFYVIGCEPEEDEGSSCADVNSGGQTGDIDMSDAIYLLTWLFNAGPHPQCPTPEDRTLPATGQSVTFGDCPGQDGFYRAGCPMPGRFVDNGDGTVTDRCTQLTWIQQTADVTSDGKITADDQLEWCEALEYCETLTFAGEDDWRLPNVRELLSILDYGRANPSVDPVFRLTRIADRNEYQYWSSTLSASNPEAVLYVEMRGGLVFSHGFAMFVLPVRGGIEGPCADVNGDGEIDISDPIRLLTWLFLGGPKPACRASRESSVPSTGQHATSGECPGQDGFQYRAHYTDTIMLRHDNRRHGRHRWLVQDLTLLSSSD